MLQFTSPIYIYFLPVILALCLAIYFRSNRGILSSILRFICLSLLLLALSDPYIQNNAVVEATNRITALVDNSSSMTNLAVQNCLKKIKNEETNKGQKIDINFFSNKIDKQERSDNTELSSRFTNYEAVINQAISKFSGDDLIICTDGKETSGNVLETKVAASNSFHSISVIFPDPGTLNNDGLEITNTMLPIRAKKSDKILLSFSVKNHSLTNLNSQIDIIINDKIFKSIPTKLEKSSEKKYDIILDSLEKGYHKVIIKDEKNSNFISRWIKIVEPPSVLLISKQDASSNLIEKILKSLNINYTIKNQSNITDISRDNVAGVIINNMRAGDFSNQVLADISSYVSGGGGLMILGGDSSYGIGGYQKTVLDKLSPLKSVPPRSKIARAPSAVMLVIDKSGSMGEQGKLRSAKLGALSSIYSLKPDDYVGVIGFDYAPLAVIELDLVSKVKINVKERLGNLTAYGATNLLPALSLARLRLSNVKAGKKHVIVLSDGQFPPSSDAFVAEINKLRGEGITVSTVALGYEADGPFMKMLANAGKGSFYQTADASVLPKLFVDDIKLAVGEDTMKEESSYQLKFGSDANDIIKFGLPPDILGFVETEAKENSKVLLQTDKDKLNFPILANWKYQQGTVTAFASDLQGRWTGPWLRWNEFFNFWSLIIKQNIKGGNENLDIKNFDLQYQINAGNLKLEAIIYDKSLSNKLGSSIVGEISSTNMKAKKITLYEKAKGRFEGVIKLTEIGDYNISLESLFEGQEDEKSFRISVEAQDLGETIRGNIDFNLLNKLKIELGANLGEIKYELKESKKDTKISRSAPIVIYLLLLSFILLVIEVSFRERGKKR